MRFVRCEPDPDPLAIHIFVEVGDEIAYGDPAAGIQPQLWPVQGAKDLWEASVRIRRLAEAVITIAVLPRRADDDQGSQLSDKLVWRGPQAPVLLPTAASLAGAITEHVLDSAALGAPRAVTVYRPPGQPAPLLGCVLADGGAARSFAGTLEPAILTGAVPPVLLVGVHNAVDPATPGPDLRAREYVSGRDQRRFDAHLGFVVDRVIPWATEQLARPRRRGLLPGSPTAATGRSRLRSADPASSPGWPPSASGSSPTRSVSGLARPGCATIWPPGPWSRASGA